MRSGDGGIADIALNHMANNTYVSIRDGLSPKIETATPATRTTITVGLTEPVTGSRTGWAVFAQGTEIGVQAVSFSGSNAVLTLSDAFQAGDVLRLVYDRGAGDTQDSGGSRLDSYNSTVDTSGLDLTAPTIRQATAVDPTTIRVEFIEPVSAGDTDGAGWSIASTYAESFAVVSGTDSGGSEMNLVLSGPLPDTGPNMNLTYNASIGTVADEASNPLATVTVRVSDGLAPTVAQASLRSPQILLVRFTENVTGLAFGFSIGNTTNQTSLHSIFYEFNNDRSFTDFLSPSVPVSDSPTLSYTAQTAVRDDANNAMLAFEDFPIDRVGYDVDGPTILYANATTPDSITVAFSEPVLQMSSLAGDWTFSGDDASPDLYVDYRTGADGDSIALLQLSKNLPDTRPDLILRYSPSADRISDEVYNPLENTDVHVTDGLKPKLLSVTARESNRIELRFGEAVTGDSGGFAAHVNATAALIQSVAGSGTDRLVLDLDAQLASTDSVTISYDGDSGTVADISSNKLDSFAARDVNVENPTSPQIASARAVSLDAITVRFTENVDADATDGSHWSLGGDRRRLPDRCPPTRIPPAPSELHEPHAVRGPVRARGRTCRVILHAAPPPGGSPDGASQPGELRP